MISCMSVGVLGAFPGWCCFSGDIRKRHPGSAPGYFFVCVCHSRGGLMRPFRGVGLGVVGSLLVFFCWLKKKKKRGVGHVKMRLRY